MSLAREQVGRPTDLDDLTTQRIVKALKAGVSRRGAAHAANIGLSTLKNWLTRGRNGEQPYADFVARVEAAEAEPERVAVDTLFQAMKEGKWQAAEAWLSRRRAIDWSQVAKALPDERQDETHEGADLTADELESLARAKRSA